MKSILYRGRKVRYQPMEKVWVFNIKNSEGKWERRVKNTFRAARKMIDNDLQGIAEP